VDDVLIQLLCPLIRCLICLIRESSRIQCREAYKQNAFHARLPESLNGRIKKAEAEPLNRRYECVYFQLFPYQLGRFNEKAVLTLHGVDAEV
jgi:hypothetical protein